MQSRFNHSAGHEKLLGKLECQDCTLRELALEIYGEDNRYSRAATVAMIHRIRRTGKAQIEIVKQQRHYGLSTYHLETV